MNNIQNINNLKQINEETQEIDKVLSLEELSQLSPAKVDLNLGMIFMIEQWKMEILTSDGTTDESSREW
ncbi:hypothetical protein [Serratia silvae]|uniref:Uncharacterized protein n=1 Tax=Serratia silvae TaxID=2824122 RepID=A0ABT0K9T3_9GAMM|nr:hypothetical protein [Serratia silvae]MCL1028775.1 hypothetical protein [Serratia silvae]